METIDNLAYYVSPSEGVWLGDVKYDWYGAKQLIVECSNCDNQLGLFNGNQRPRLPKICPHCGAEMINGNYWW